jgi:hypothetical protein
LGAAKGGAAPAAPSATQKAKPLQDEFGEEEATRVAGPGALLGAISAVLNEHAPASVADPLSMPGDEWFVGINGVPVGPIRLSELRAKAAAGAITKESLVWRDGFEEWRALKSFPELVAVVEEGLSSTRAAAVIPSGGQPGGPLTDPFAATSAPTAAAPSPGAVTGPAVVTDDLDLAGLRRRSSTSPAAWIAMVVAVLFGITLGFVLFGRNTQGGEKTDKPSGSGTAAAAAPEASVARVNASPAAEELVVSGDTKTIAKGSGTGSKTVPKAGEGDTKLSGGLKGLGLNGLSPGMKGPTEGGQSAPGTGQLDSGQLQAAVARYTPSVKRTCWQPALDTRDKDAPMSARVSVSITVGASGSVQDVTTGGDPKGYRGLAGCIAGRVRGWQFPPSGGSTTVNVPFVFVAQ